MYIIMKVDYERQVIVSELGSERSEDKRSAFWEKLSNCFGSFGEKD